MYSGEAAAPSAIGKMNYKNFAKITHKYGIVCEGWPLERFCSPGDINSVPELTVLRNAFTSGAAFFRRLSDVELEEWRERQAAHAHQLAVGAATETTSTQDLTSNAAQPGPAFLETASPSTAVNDGPSHAGTSTPLVSSSQANAPPPSSSSLAVVNTQHAAVVNAQHPAVVNQNQVVFTVNGGALVPRKPRKQREDKGKKRGPYKRTKGRNADDNTAGA